MTKTAQANVKWRQKLANVLQCAQLLQRTQIIRHVTKLLDHLGIAEIARSRVTSARERDRANMTFLARQRFCSHHNSDRVEAFDRFTGRNAIIGSDERQSDVVRDLWHGDHPVKVLNLPCLYPRT